MIVAKELCKVCSIVLFLSLLVSNISAAEKPDDISRDKTNKRGWLSSFRVFNIFRHKSKEEKKERKIIKKIKQKGRTLKNKKILIICKEPPNNDVPSFGFGDGFFYTPRLVEYLKKVKGAKEVYIAPPKALTRFFKTCSDLKVLEDDANCTYERVDVRELLDAIPNIHKFKSKKRYLSGPNCKWASKEVDKLVDAFKKSNIIPVVVTRQSSTVPRKYARQRKFKYLTKRSMSREQAGQALESFYENAPFHKERPWPWKAFDRILNRGKKNVVFFNIQFEDQKLPDISGMLKPETIWEGYKNCRGAFVNDAIFMKAALKVGGKILSVDTAAACLSLGIPSKHDLRKNIYLLLATERNSRWKGEYVNPDGFSAWSPNVVLVKQEYAGDWMSAFEIVMQDLLKQKGKRERK